MSKERLVELIMSCKTPLISKPIAMSVAEDLIKFGVIVPTYNIGQTVYAVAKGDNLWWKGTVASICYEFNEMSYGISFDDGDFAMFEEEDVFPTREEAEKALRKDD